MFIQGKKTADVIGQGVSGSGKDAVEVFAAYVRSAEGNLFVSFRCPLCGRVHFHSGVTRKEHDAHCENDKYWDPRRGYAVAIPITEKFSSFRKGVFRTSMTDDFSKAGDLHLDPGMQRVTVEEAESLIADALSRGELEA